MNADIERTLANLAFIASNPIARYPKGWLNEVNTEAVKLGLRNPAPSQIGCACRPEIDRGIIYGADFIDAL